MLIEQFVGQVVKCDWRHPWCINSQMLYLISHVAVLAVRKYMTCRGTAGSMLSSSCGAVACLLLASVLIHSYLSVPNQLVPGGGGGGHGYDRPALQP